MRVQRAQATEPTRMGEDIRRVDPLRDRADVAWQLADLRRSDALFDRRPEAVGSNDLIRSVVKRRHAG